MQQHSQAEKRDIQRKHQERLLAEVPDDPTAKSLKYVHDAVKSARPSADQFCNNCRYFRGAQTDEWAPCDLFPGKQVAGAGWCNVWAKKG